MKLSLMIARFPYGRVEDPDVNTYLGKLRVQLAADPRFRDGGTVCEFPFDDTPVTMTRNRSIKMAQEANCDLLLLIDNDISADAYLNYRNSKPFFWSSLEHILEHPGPCIVAAPYCGPPPEELVYIFQLTTKQSNHPNVDFALNMIPREQAASRLGFEEVIALPTGLMLIDMRCLKLMRPPYFKYEYTDEFETDKASTEDVFFTRNAAFAGVKVYCNWYSWAGHWKRKMVGPPSLLTPDMIRDAYREAVKGNNMVSQQSLAFIKTKVPAHGDRRPDNAAQHVLRSEPAQEVRSGVQFRDGG